MLSDEDKREMKAAAMSAVVRQEFETVRALSQLPPDQPVGLDDFVRFLTFMSQLTPQPAPQPPIPYPHARL